MDLYIYDSRDRVLLSVTSSPTVSISLAASVSLLCLSCALCPSSSSSSSDALLRLSAWNKSGFRGHCCAAMLFLQPISRRVPPHVVSRLCLRLDQLLGHLNSQSTWGDSFIAPLDYLKQAKIHLLMSVLKYMFLWIWFWRVMGVIFQMLKSFAVGWQMLAGAMRFRPPCILPPAKPKPPFRKKS